MFEQYKLPYAYDADENSVVLLINTEGDTDPENYKRVVNN